MSTQHNLTSLAISPKRMMPSKLPKQDPSTPSDNKNKMNARGPAASVGPVMRPKTILKAGQAGSSVNDATQGQNFGELTGGNRRGSALGRRQRSPSTSYSDGSEACRSSDEPSNDETPVALKKAKISEISGMPAIKRPRALNPAYNTIPNQALFSMISIKPASTLPSAALEGFIDAPHPAFLKDGKKTSNLASFAKIKILVERYIQAEDALTDRGKMNFENLLTMDGYPSTETVRRLAKMYVRMVENGTGEDKRLEWFKGAFYRYPHLPAEMQGAAHESFVGGELEKEKMAEKDDDRVEYDEKEEGEISDDEESVEGPEWESGVDSDVGTKSKVRQVIVISDDESEDIIS